MKNFLQFTDRFFTIKTKIKVAENGTLQQKLAKDYYERMKDIDNERLYEFSSVEMTQTFLDRIKFYLASIKVVFILGLFELWLIQVLACFIKPAQSTRSCSAAVAIS